MLNINILMHDENTFIHEYPKARAFLLEAQLRYECFSLSRIKRKTLWQKERLQELLNYSPACQENWFLKLIGKDS